MLSREIRSTELTLSRRVSGVKILLTKQGEGGVREYVLVPCSGIEVRNGDGLGL